MKFLNLLQLPEKICSEDRSRPERWEWLELTLLLSSSWNFHLPPSKLLSKNSVFVCAAWHWPKLEGIFLVSVYVTTVKQHGNVFLVLCKVQHVLLARVCAGPNKRENTYLNCLSHSYWISYFQQKIYWYKKSEK